MYNQVELYCPSCGKFSMFEESRDEEYVCVGCPECDNVFKMAICNGDGIEWFPRIYMKNQKDETDKSKTNKNLNLKEQ
jgi:uncharacterized Zn finger protein